VYLTNGRQFARRAAFPTATSAGSSSSPNSEASSSRVANQARGEHVVAPIFTGFNPEAVFMLAKPGLWRSDEGTGGALSS